MLLVYPHQSVILTEVQCQTPRLKFSPSAPRPEFLPFLFFILPCVAIRSA